MIGDRRLAVAGALGECSKVSANSPRASIAGRRREALKRISRKFEHALKSPSATAWLIVFFLILQSSAVAATLPSLFRGIVVANSEMGIRVVSIDEESQAALADLRPEDIITQVNGTPLTTIDEFAQLSKELRSRSTKAAVVVLRNGQSRELLVHLYSYPVLRTWGLQFVPDYDLRFIDPSAALVYWLRMARGFEGAGQLDQALNATLNALHYQPEQLDIAVHATELLSRIARAQAGQGRLLEAMASLRQATLLMERLFEMPLDTAHLQAIKTELAQTIETLKRRQP